MATIERDIFGKRFTVGDYVMVRCLVTAIAPVMTGNQLGGSADTVSLLVESPTVNDDLEVVFTCSPQQCRFAGDPSQA